jgi:uncharacterized BrkB/YihY/UPF0761 family membrane protein
MVEEKYLVIWFARRFGPSPATLAAWHYLRWVVTIVVAVLAVQLLYYFGPDVKQRFRNSLAGARFVRPAGKLLPTLRQSR